MIYCEDCANDVGEVVTTDVEKGIEFTIITEHCKCNYCKSTFDVVNTKRVTNKVVSQFHNYKTLHYQFIEEFEIMVDNYLTSNAHFSSSTKKKVNHMKQQFMDRMSIDPDDIEKEYVKQEKQSSVKLY